MKKKTVKAWMVGTGGRTQYTIYKKEVDALEHASMEPFDVPVIECRITYPIN